MRENHPVDKNENDLSVDLSKRGAGRRSARPTSSAIARGIIPLLKIYKQLYITNVKPPRSFTYAQDKRGPVPRLPGFPYFVIPGSRAVVVYRP